MKTLSCPTCGAPLPPRSYRVVVTCLFCGASSTRDEDLVHAKDYREAVRWRDAASRGASREHGPSVEIAGVPYRLLGLVGSGDSSEVFLATRAHAVTERVLIKFLRAAGDRDLLDAEWRSLKALDALATPASAALKRRLPQPVARERAVIDGTPGPEASVFRAISGFVHTFDDVRAVYPNGVDPRHASWMWRRVLELLAGLHESGWVHGAVIPPHLVVHPRDHGVMLVGYACAGRIADHAGLVAASRVSREIYPAELLDNRRAPVTPATDIVMSARCVALLLGGSATRVPESVPRPLADLVEAWAKGDGRDEGRHGGQAWQVRGAVAKAAEASFGPPRFYRFEMPE